MELAKKFEEFITIKDQLETCESCEKEVEFINEVRYKDADRDNQVIWLCDVCLENFTGS